MAQPYQLTPDYPGSMESVLHLASGRYIPFDPSNVDYQTYVQWVAAGNTPDPAPTTP